MTDWIVVPGWRKFQHYQDGRQPVWIKLYTDLQSRDEWLELTLAQRGLLVCIWIEYARSRGRVSVRALHGQVQSKFQSRTLDSLRKAGFIRISSRPEVEVEEKRSSELPKPRRNSNVSGGPELLSYPEWLDTLKQKAVAL